MYIIEQKGWQVFIYYLHSSYKLRKHIVQRCVVIIYDFNIRVLLCNIFIIKWYKRTGDIIFGHFSFKEMFLLMETKFWTTRSLEDSGVPSSLTIINTAVSPSSKQLINETFKCKPIQLDSQALRPLPSCILFQIYLCHDLQIHANSILLTGLFIKLVVIKR